MPDTSSAPAVPFEPIPCTALDKDNAEWAKKYVEKWKARLEAEGPDDPDFAQLAQREIAQWEELLARFGKL